MVKAISLISHACVLIELDGLKILTDPWFYGSAFNDGWALEPAPELEKLPALLAEVDIVWISHEHPDHFHLSTLKQIRELLPERVQIAFQTTNSTKVFGALEKLGYTKFLPMEHMKRYQITDGVEILIYSHRHIDSTLSVFVDGKHWILNINDTELTARDISLIRRRSGDPEIILNQFSIAGSTGIEDLIRKDAEAALKNIVSQHALFRAKYTIPFASFMKFSKPDNDFLNKFSNSIADVRQAFELSGLDLLLMKPMGLTAVWNQTSEVGPINFDALQQEAIEFFRDASVFENSKGENIPDEEPMSRDDVREVVLGRCRKLKNRTFSPIYHLLNQVVFRVEDWEESWKLDFRSFSFARCQDTDYDIKIRSQPLYFAFKMPFGVQTLGVSGRYTCSESLTQMPRSWRIFRALTSLENAEIYLGLRSFLDSKTLFWLWQKRKGLLTQLIQQLRRP
jgi:UDP-MurNAc hydroxylase